ncbi:MAG: tetratricopeptide repeat protein [Planctomycetes bacterium]|nr:tetratricopeptide repeat protein [Planctomycetota bacterium]
MARRSVVWCMLGLVVVCGLAWVAWRPDPEALLAKGLATVARDPVVAESYFQRALLASAFPLRSEAQLGLCLAWGRQQKWDEVRREFPDIELANCRPRLLYEFGRVAVDANQIDEARQTLEELAQRHVRDSVDALDLLIVGYRRWGLQNEMLAVARELTTRFPDRFDIWSIQVEALRAMKLDQECLETARQAMQHDPPDDYRREFQLLIVEMLINRAEVETARQELETLQTLEGESFRTRACEASLFRLEGRFDEALKVAASLFGDQRLEPTAHMIRGFVYLDRGDFEKAVADFKLTIAAQPYNTQAHFKLSEAYRGLGKPAEALAHSRLANDLSAKRLEINVLLKLRAGQREPASAIARKLADLFEEIGDTAAAAHWRRQAGSE